MDRTAVCTGVQDRRGAAPTLRRHWALRPGEQRAVTKRGGRSTCTRRQWCWSAGVGGVQMLVLVLVLVLHLGLAAVTARPDASRPRKLHGTAAPLHRTGKRATEEALREALEERQRQQTRGRSPCQMPAARCQRASDFGATQRRRSCAYNSDDSSPTREGILASRHACSPFPVSASSYSLITNNVRPCAPAKQWSWAFGRAKNLRTHPPSTCQ